MAKKRFNKFGTFGTQYSGPNKLFQKTRSLEQTSSLQQTIINEYVASLSLLDKQNLSKNDIIWKNRLRNAITIFFKLSPKQVEVLDSLVKRYLLK